MPVIYHNNEYVSKNKNEIKRLFDDNQLIIENDDLGNTDFNFGVYYEKIKHQYSKAVDHYIKSIEKDNINSMNNLGKYYQEIKNHNLSKKYYLMAIDKGNSTAMYLLGLYYHKIEKKYDEAKKYYLMSFEKDNNADSINYLGFYYHTIEKNYDEAKKYYLMAIDKGHLGSMNNLAKYYQEIKNYDEAKKYYLMAIEKGNSIAKTNIKNIISDLELYILCNENNIKIELPRDFYIFNNKINMASKQDDCPICMETKKCIPLECCHYFCTDCYPKIYKKLCAICKL